jgi:1-acyl-sn-glycerol-3-phosphate acyltransferase
MTLFYRGVRDAARLLFRLAGRTHVVGHASIPREGGVVVACNHVSYLDPPLVGSNIARECAFMARHDLWQPAWQGRLISALNAFPVKRDTADRGAIREALRILDRGLVLVLFPEGTRSPDGFLQDPQPGLALIVQRSGAPVVPAVVIGPETMLPPGASRPRRARLTVVFGPTMRFTPDASRDEILTGVMDQIAELLRRHRRGVPPRRDDPPSVP